MQINPQYYSIVRSAWHIRPAPRIALEWGNQYSEPGEEQTAPCSAGREPLPVEAPLRQRDGSGARGRGGGAARHISFGNARVPEVPLLLPSAGCVRRPRTRGSERKRGQVQSCTPRPETPPKATWPRRIPQQRAHVRRPGPISTALVKNGFGALALFYKLCPTVVISAKSLVTGNSSLPSEYRMKLTWPSM